MWGRMAGRDPELYCSSLLWASLSDLILFSVSAATGFFLLCVYLLYLLFLKLFASLQSVSLDYQLLSILCFLCCLLLSAALMFGDVWYLVLSPASHILLSFLCFSRPSGAPPSVLPYVVPSVLPLVLYYAFRCVLPYVLAGCCPVSYPVCYPTVYSTM
jgi:hypothetical protein